MSNKRYEILPDNASRIPAKLLYVSTSKYGGDWHSTIHSHYFAEFFYVIHGEGQFVVEDKRFNVKEDDLVIVNPSVEHTEISLINSPLEYIVLGIDGLAFMFNNAQQSNYSLINYRAQRQELLFYLKLLLREIESKEEYHETVCQNILEVLLVNMIRNNHFLLASTQRKKANKECEQVKRYIDEHFKENISLDDLSELCHINKYYLVHTFGRDNGMSPINYLISKRIEESKLLLETTDHSVSQISHIVGFSSQSYFSQGFKRAVGIGPNEYRKRIKKQRSTVVLNLE